MEVKAKKSARFKQLVAALGKPEEVTLWTAPEENRDFMKAAREHRLVTIMHQNTGNKADYGLAGFVKRPGSLFLVFPKRLPFEAETKIIGIKYDQVAESAPKGPLQKVQKREDDQFARRRTKGKTRSTPEKSSLREPEELQAKHPEPKPSPARAKIHRYQTKVEIVAEQSVPLEVEASSAAEAAKLVKERAEEIQPDLKEAKITRRIGKPRER